MYPDFLNTYRSTEQQHCVDSDDGMIANADVLSLRCYPNFRTSVDSHHKYDVVWSIARPIDMQGWKIYLNELIQLLKKTGILIIAYKQNANLSVFALKNFLFRKYNLKVELLFEKNENCIIYYNVFRIEKLFYQERLDKKWTFGLLTLGNKVSTVERLLSTIRHDDTDSANQIIIVGPRNLAYDKYHVEYIDKVYSTEYADISIKKNDIIQAAKHQNIMLLHDRYFLSNDFFKGFEQYGYDFEFLTIRQMHLSGKEYPAFCAVNDKQNLIWAPVYYCDDMQTLWPTVYLNGGLLIGKKYIFEAFPFNNFLFHHQAEDVELSRVMYTNHIIPRINLYSSAITDSSEELVASFVKATDPDFDYLYIHKNDFKKVLYEQTYRYRCNQWLQLIWKRYGQISAAIQRRLREKIDSLRR